ncbi:unnamed protein product [Heligmosomoides polygyrus]|uniref:RRP7 domain-containing protein n=1 Tax=Heligmosomoides polygyrus TaxID=6339 RepID=A0A183FVY9_HELPZ|nr:unnamed protein product [Heligmosomoides polygyrus]
MTVAFAELLSWCVGELSTNSFLDLRYSISDRYSTPRQLFLKMDKSNECSLIVGNVPSYLPRVRFGQLTLSVRFEDPKGVDVALSTCQDAGPFKVCDFVDAKMPSVLHSSVDLYRKLFPSAEEIQKSAMDFIQMQDEEVQEAKRAAKRKLTEPDEEGWITVTKAAKRVYYIFLGRQGNKVDIAFYSFDKKNTRAQKLNELREKFMQDKKRIALLKNARKFKPD